MQEVWKPVVGFEEWFEISNIGRLKRIKQIITTPTCKKEIKVDRIINSTLDRGYAKVNLSINGKRYLRYIHRMVAEAFIPNPNNYKEVNHIDSNPSNNNVNNLEWCDREYNLEFMKKHQEKIKERHEKRIEALEMIKYLASINDKVDSKKINDIIDNELLGEY